MPDMESIDEQDQAEVFDETHLDDEGDGGYDEGDGGDGKDYGGDGGGGNG